MDAQLSNLKIKDSWDQITISDFMMIQDITTNAKHNALEKMLKTLGVLAGVSDEFFNKFLIPDLTEFAKKADFLKTLPETPLKQYYTIGGKRYKLIGKFSDLTTGQFIDLNHFSKDGVLDNLHIIISIFLHPVIEKTRTQKLVEKLGLKKYRDVENYMETSLELTSQNVYSNMLYQDANAISLFFCVVGQAFTAISMDYLKSQKNQKLQLVSKMLNEIPKSEENAATIQQIKEKITSIKNGDGFPG